MKKRKIFYGRSSTNKQELSAELQLNEVEEKFLSIENLKSLGFKPQFRIENGYPVYIEWYLKNNKKFKIGG